MFVYFSKNLQNMIFELLQDNNLRVKSKKYSDLFGSFFSSTSFCNLHRSTPSVCLSLYKCCCIENRSSAETFKLHILHNNTDPSVKKRFYPNSCTN